MDVLTSDLSPDRLYKLLVSTVMPRPIALISTISADGTLNAAPFSFFNVFSNAPPLVVVGIEGSRREESGSHKDSARNIIERGEFVVNLVSHRIAERMVVCSVDFPQHTNEFEEAGFTQRPSKEISAPGIAESPVNFECRLYDTQSLPRSRTLVIGEILHIHIDDDAINEKMHVDVEKLDLVGRMHGGGWYSTTRDRFEIPRMTVDEWNEKKTRDPK